MRPGGLPDAGVQFGVASGGVNLGLETYRRKREMGKEMLTKPPGC